MNPNNAQLFTDRAEGKYLRNRLWSAFMAGYNAAEPDNSASEVTDDRT
jgi:hypothetical protein